MSLEIKRKADLFRRELSLELFLCKPLLNLLNHALEPSDRFCKRVVLWSDSDAALGTKNVRVRVFIVEDIPRIYLDLVNTKLIVIE